jgi:hypothetical protein
VAKYLLNNRVQQGWVVGMFHYLGVKICLGGKSMDLTEGFNAKINTPS